MKKILAAALSAAFAATPAFAHHAMGGGKVATLGQGLLSGLAHPVIGLDHLAFVLAGGALAAFLPRGGMAIAAFLGATLAGCGLHAAGLSLPFVEPLVAVSVILIGAALMARRTTGAGLWTGFFGLAGLIHGYAYGESIFGVEATPLAGYLVGFIVIQGAIMTAARLATARATESAMWPRLAGAAVAGVGATFLVQALELSAFGAI